MKTSTNNSKTKFVLELPEATQTYVTGDENRIRQILMNFISNALKFAEQGIVKFGYKAKPINEKFANYIFYVSDDGVGISKKDQKRLFKAFEQADASTTRKFGGTGLGLTISSNLASLMNGKVYCESKEGVGSTFFLELDLENGEAPLSINKPKDFCENLSEKYPHTILLAEDNKINQKVVSMTLNKLGYQCDFAINGKEVLEKLKQKTPEHYTLILMDIQMPEMDGLTATKEIKKIYGQKSPQILALTANAFAIDKKDCFDAGMSGYLSKPLKREELIKALMDLCVQSEKKRSA